MAGSAGCRVPRRRNPFEEVRRFLATWYFFISETGFLYARPLKDRISLMEFRAFMKRMYVVCQGELPGTIVVDVSHIPSNEKLWVKCQPLVDQFATRMNAIARFGTHGRHAAILIWRRGTGPHIPKNELA